MIQVEDADIVFLKNEEEKIMKELRNPVPIIPPEWNLPYNTVEKINKTLKEKIKDYQEMHDEKKDSYESLMSSLNLNEKKDVKVKLQKMMENQKGIEEETKQLRESLCQKEELLETLRKKKIEAESQLKDIPLRIKKEYDVFAGTFHIKWDNTAAENEVKGCILRQANSEIVPFSFNTETNSQYFITNFLWQQMGDPDKFLE